MPADRTNSSMTPVDGHRPISSTCLACRQRKVKCDSGKPRCKNCVQLGMAECIYKERQKPGLKAGVGTQLVDRVAALEAALTEQQHRLDDVFAHLERRPASRPSSWPPREGPVQQALVATPSVPPEAIPSVNTENSAEDSVSFKDYADLPPHDMVLQLIDLFYQHVAPFAPFLPREELFSNQDPGTPGLSPPGWPVTVYAIVVISLRFSFDPRWQMPGFSKKEHYHQIAKQRVVMHAIESTSVQSLQALAIIALDTIGNGAGPSAWGVLALLTRCAMHLGLHNEEDVSPDSKSSPLSRLSLLRPAKSFREEEGRRRLFWTIYVLDRWASASTGWDFALTDDNVTRNLPCPEYFWTNNTPVQTRPFRSPVFEDGLFPEGGPVDPLAYLIEIADLLGRVHQLHRQPLNAASQEEVAHFYECTRALDVALRRWYSRLPQEVSTPAGPNSHAMVVLVQAMFHAALIKLNSIVAYPSTTSAYMQPSPEAAGHLVHSAKQIAALSAGMLSDAAPSDASPFLAWCMWVAARVLFIQAYHTGTSVDEAINHLLQALEAAGRFWDVARRYEALLRKAVEKVSEHEGYQSIPSGSRSRATAVAALLDMRRTAFGAGVAVPVDGAETPSDPVPPDDYARILDNMLSSWANEQNVLDFQWFELPNMVM